MKQLQIAPESATPELLIKAAALAGVHCLLQRRSLTAIRIVGQPSVRSREVVWCVTEALHAAFDGRRLTHKELAAVADGVISPATLTRALDRAVKRKLVTRRVDPEDARVMLIEPTRDALAYLLAHAEEGFAELTELVHGFEAKLDTATAQPPQRQAI
jgi:DNA-binding MarR family transcriptional regulator